MDNYNLKVRTKDRSCWKDISSIPYMGIEGTIDETPLDLINKNLVQTVVDIVDDAFRIKEEQLLTSVQLEQDKIATEKAIVDSKAETRRTILAMIALTNTYILGIEGYIILVKSLLMDAREYALTIDKKRIALGLLQAELAEEKGEIKVKGLNLKIQLETLNRKFVEVEVTRAELNVAKADVKLVLAEVAVKEARLKEVEARIELVMTDVEKAGLIADIAMIYAEIAVKELTKRKYEVESAEIAAEYARIANKLASILAILVIQQEQVTEQDQLQAHLLGDVETLQGAKEDHLDIQEEAAQVDLEIKEYEEIAINLNLISEEGLKASLLLAKEDYDNQRRSGAVDTDAAALAAEAMVKSYSSSTGSNVVSSVQATSSLARAISRG